MSTTAVISSVASRRIARASAWLERREPAREVLIVGASLDAANELARRAVLPKGAAFGWHRLTLPQLAAAVARPVLATRQLVPLSRLGVEAIAARLVHRLREAGGLGRYGRVAETPGFPRAIAGVIKELRLEGVAADEIRKVAPDLVSLTEAYGAELADAGLTDWPGVLTLAARAVRERGRGQHPLIGLPVLLLDVPIDSAAELAFVGALSTAAPEMLVTVPAADGPTLDRLRHGLRIDEEDLDEAHRAAGPADGALARLHRNLFQEHAALPATPSDTEVGVFSAPGENRECVEIARRVLKLADGGMPFDRMAVLLRSPEEYRAHLEEAFARAGVPVHFARGAVRPDPAGRAFFALLKCAAEGLSARRFAEYLSLGQLPDASPGGTPPEAAPRHDRWIAPDSELFPASDPEELAEPPAAKAADQSDEGPVRHGQLRAPRRWERLLVESAVIGGRDRWRRRIDGLAQDLRLRLLELDEEDEARAAGFARTIDDLAALADYALPLIDDLDGLPPAASWQDWLDRLGAIATRALREPDRVLAIMSELAPMAPVGPVTLKEVLLVLEPLLLEVVIPPRSNRYGCVFAAPIEAARGLSFEAVFVPGLAEKMFPRKIIEEPILLDAARTRICGTLATNRTRLQGERLALALAAGAAERHIAFSYPRLDLVQARPRVPSFYALETVRAAEGSLPDFAGLARRAETATMSRLGWPAPPDPADAIDDSEHDLAIFHRLVSPPGEKAGTARYLLSANPHLARALRARFQRWGKTWTAADGLLSKSDETRAVMARHSPRARVYSPTALQDYARCPYRFFLHAIQGLGPREVPEAIDALDPLQRGSLIHDVQFELFAALKGANLLPVRPGTLKQAHRMLDGVLDAAAARYRDDLAPAIDRVWQDGIDAIRADLREWLRRTSEDESGYVPWHFELSFGLAQRAVGRRSDSQSVRGAVDLDSGLQLRGAIDLVERHPSRFVRVTDHKTGKSDGRRGRITDGGTSLQPLLYALAAEKLFADQATVTSGRLYFCTSAGGFDEQVVELDDRARAAAGTVAGAIEGAVARPFLPAAPAAGQCAICDYRVVCGQQEERRTARKPRRELAQLLEVRSLP